METTQVNWSATDYSIAFAFLLVFVLIGAFIWRKYTAPTRWKVLFVAAVVFALIWIELAVGIFGTPFAGS